VPIPEGVILHISHAAFAEETAAGEVARLFVQVDDKKFAFCTLVGQTNESATLDLNFDAGTKVSFMVEGAETTVHLTGYYSILEDEIDENELLSDEEEPQINVYGSDDDGEETMNTSSLSESSTSKLLSTYANLPEDDSEDDEFEPNQDDLNDSKDYKLDLSYLEQEDGSSDDSDDSDDDISEEQLRATIAEIQKQQAKKEQQQQQQQQQQKQGKKRKHEESPSKPQQQQNKKLKQSPQKQSTPQKSPQQNQKKSKKNKQKK
jgi:hypothetical protein